MKSIFINQSKKRERKPFPIIIKHYVINNKMEQKKSMIEIVRRNN